MDDQDAMSLAIEQAQLAEAAGDVPVGAVIVSQGKVIGQGHNIREKAQNPLGHAEIVALKDASENLNSWRILDSTMYVTLEPCLMCAGAIFASRVDRLVFSAFDSNCGVFGSTDDFSSQNRMNHTIEVVGGFRSEETSQMLKAFFRKARNR